MTDTKTTKAKSANVWTDEERAAMQESARERKSAASAARPTNGLKASAICSPRSPRCRPAIAPWPSGSTPSYGSAPVLAPKTYYGMPAYAKDGKVICFFQPASKFKVRYSTFGFQPEATIDDGDMWPVAFAIGKLTPEVEARIAALVKRTVT